MFLGLNSIQPKLNNISGITIKIKNQIKQMGTGLKSGFVNILKQAGALLGLRSIYNVLRNSASSWLSSQNTGAQQLSANIEYMKYSMGSVFAPVIEYIVNLVYQLMKAIQSVVYAFSGVNIFAKATAKSMGKTAGNAKQTSKSLAGIHNEINNISEKDNEGGGNGSVTPNIDLSKMENTSNSIVDAIKQGNWYEVGATIGNKLNEALAKISWDKIQVGAKNIATNIANFLNGFIEKSNWNQVGNTFAQGLNTVIYFAYSFVTTFNWSNFGKAIGDSINGFFLNIDWAILGQTLSNSFKGVLDTIGTAISTIDWWGIGEKLYTFLANIDWAGIVSKLFNVIGKALGGLSQLLAGFLIEAVQGIGNFFGDEIEQCGGNIVLGILKGIVDGLLNIGIWIGENIVKPLIDGFCELLGIHSPSTVFAEFGKNIIQGLFEGIKSLINTIIDIWNKLKEKTIEIFNNIKTAISEKIQQIKDFIKNILDTIKEIWGNIWNNISNFVKNIWNDIKTTTSNIINNIKSIISNILNSINNKWNEIWNAVTDKISTVWDTIKTKVKDGAKGAWNAITSVFGNISNWFNEKFSQAWQSVKNVFSKGGAIFDGIKDGILNGLKNIVNGIINAINKIIKVPFNGLNSALRKIKNVNIMGFQPFSWIGTISVPEIPKLAKGNVAYSPLIAQFGEYSGARSNPEITTPQNIMRETFEDVLSNFSSSNSQSIELSVYVGNEKLGKILLDNLRTMKRQTGKGIEALIGG